MALRVGLIGFGTVGQSVAKRLIEDGQRLRLARGCGRPGGRGRPSWLPPSVAWTTRFDDLLRSDIDVVVELVGGMQPARQWLHKALLGGMSVVTANKQLVAEHGAELAWLAARSGCAFRYEAAVAGGVPVIRAIEDGLAGDHLVRVTGVVNGTCNYVLSQMERTGVSFAQALNEAQSLGYAEADPTADVEGFDARAKLAILCQVAFGARVRPSDIVCESIASVTSQHLASARADGHAVRQIARAVRDEDGGIAASVRPERVPLDSPFARAQGCQNVVAVEGRFGGETVFAGRGAGGDATAVAVLSDLFAVAADRRNRAELQQATPASTTRSRREPSRAAGRAAAHFTVNVPFMPMAK